MDNDEIDDENFVVPDSLAPEALTLTEPEWRVLFACASAWDDATHLEAKCDCPKEPIAESLAMCVDVIAHLAQHGLYVDVVLAKVGAHMMAGIDAEEGGGGGGGGAGCGCP